MAVYAFSEFYFRNSREEENREGGCERETERKVRRGSMSKPVISDNTYPIRCDTVGGGEDVINQVPLIGKDKFAISNRTESARLSWEMNRLLHNA